MNLEGTYRRASVPHGISPFFRHAPSFYKAQRDENLVESPARIRLRRELGFTEAPGLGTLRQQGLTAPDDPRIPGS